MGEAFGCFYVSSSPFLVGACHYIHFEIVGNSIRFLNKQPRSCDRASQAPKSQTSFGKVYKHYATCDIDIGWQAWCIYLQVRLGWTLNMLKKLLFCNTAWGVKGAMVILKKSYIRACRATTWWKSCAKGIECEQMGYRHPMASGLGGATSDFAQ